MFRFISSSESVIFSRLPAAVAAVLVFVWGGGMEALAQGRVIRIVNTQAVAGQNVVVPVELVSQGNENAVGFSLEFNPAILTNPSVSLGSAAGSASLYANLASASTGRIGVALALQAPQVFAAGTRQIVNLTFSVPANAASGATTILFGDQPVAREVVDADANTLPANFTSGTISVTQPNPLPVLSTLNPTSALVGTPGLTLTINGQNFLSNSVARWNGADRTTTYVSPTQLQAAITAQDLSANGTVAVTVFNPSPVGGLSNSLTFTINNPAPTISSLSPSSVIIGAGDTQIIINGTGFLAGTKVQWNGVDRASTLLSGTQLRITATAAELAAAATVTITVLNPGPGGGAANATFGINNPLPQITSINPLSSATGSAGFQLTVYGNNFIAASKVRWNGSERVTTFVGSTQLTATIPSSDLIAGATVPITVSNPAPGGGVSNALNFIVSNPVPAVTSVDPATVPAGSAVQTLTVTGTGFIVASKVQWNGADRITAFVNSAQLTVTIPASDLSTAGTASITVVNPLPGGGTSNSFSFNVTNTVPAIQSISPVSTPAGSAALLITVNGSGFVAASKARWNGSDRVTNFVSATQLTFTATLADLAATGSAAVTVFNPAPGGGTSNSVTFSISQPPNPVPSISGLSPAFVPAGIGGFQLTVNGSNFISGSKVLWNGSERNTILVNSGQLKADIPAQDVAVQGSATITVTNPSPGGGASNGPRFVIAGLLSIVSAASYAADEIATESIVAVFGNNLATSIANANTSPLPVSLAGTTVRLKDSAGTDRQAQIFFVSPTQVNFLVPQGTVAGPSSLTITGSDNQVSTGTVSIVNVAPGVFTADASGNGLAAANALRVLSNGSQVQETVARFDDALKAYVATPIDLGPASDQVFLILYGTGFRYRSSLSAVTATIGGTAASVTYAGVSPDYIGLDQCNILIPRSLIGRGDVNVILIVDGKTAKTVRINIK